METKITWIIKPIGWNPTDCISELKSMEEYKNDKLAFAGRLDPIACGLMAIVSNEKVDPSIRCKIQDCYKKYNFNVALGFKSDTYDILGLPIKIDGYDVPDVDTIMDKMDKISKIKEQEYPPYSSKSIYSDYHNKKVQLWKLAREGNLPNKLPTRNIDIDSFSLIDLFLIDGKNFGQIIKHRINCLPTGFDFRQNEIIEKWEELQENDEITVLQCEAVVSVGTYVRGLANMLDGVVFDICRTGVGNKVININEVDKFSFSILNE